jgi:DNA invertase Pin-like site-specific DNA recombinase
VTEKTRTFTGRIVGYARVSTEGQDLDLQLDALRKHGAADELIFADRASGAKSERPGLSACLDELKTGDVLLVWRLDRLGRSVRHLVTLVDELRDRGVGFRSVCDGAIDTTTASGKLIFNVFSALAEFERSLIQERTMAGLAAARARGRKGGRRPISVNDPRVQAAKLMYGQYQQGEIELPDILKTLSIKRTTLYRYVAL